MQDQHFMQSWTIGHRQFSNDLARRLNRIGSRFSRRPRGPKSIDDPYGLPSQVGPRRALPPAASASLRGLGATVLTAALWIVVMALATPAPGLAETAIAPVAGTDCAAYPVLA